MKTGWLKHDIKSKEFRENAFIFRERFKPVFKISKEICLLLEICTFKEIGSQVLSS